MLLVLFSPFPPSFLVSLRSFFFFLILLAYYYYYYYSYYFPPFFLYLHSIGFMGAVVFVASFYVFVLMFCLGGLHFHVLVV